MPAEFYNLSWEQYWKMHHKDFEGVPTVIVAGSIARDPVLPVGIQVSIYPGLSDERVKEELKTARERYQQALICIPHAIDQRRPANAEDAKGDEYEDQ